MCKEGLTGNYLPVNPSYELSVFVINKITPDLNPTIRLDLNLGYVPTI